MNKYIYILLLIIFVFKAYSYADSNDIKKIEMEVFRNGEVIGYSNYFFDQKDNIIIIKNNTKFKVELFGVSVFSISSKTVETYENDKLIYFKSKTIQNSKEKYVNLNYDQSLKKLIVDGSSYKGEASTDCIVGNWWNHKILKANCQISPLSGSIKDQIVTFLGKENISLYGKNYLVHHYKLKSKDENMPDNKKLDFDIWLNSENNLILKVAYSKMGDWEYRLKNFE
tara:strand:+ start:694 stop:1371 length:678 start_codon:yes stop_codon:yes gene_type:complete